MRIFGIAGWSGGGKTTLLLRLIPVLAGQGIRVATLKHSHHDLDFGDDECRALAAAGACEVAVASDVRFGMIHHTPVSWPEPTLSELVPHVAAMDLVLVEGWKFSPHPKLEVWDAGLGRPMLAETDPSVVALACDRQSPCSRSLPRFRRDDVEAIAGFVARYCLGQS